MPFENKMMRLIAGVDTREKMRKLFQYFKEKDIEVPEYIIRTAMNKLYTLPEDSTDAST